MVRPRSEPSAQGQGGPGLPVLLGEEEAREADKARLALGPSARKEWGRRRCLLLIGVILRILDWTAMRGSYGGCNVYGPMRCNCANISDICYIGWVSNATTRCPTMAQPSQPAGLLSSAQ